ncbi:hypothetical protein [Kineococcus sp. SYSU DK005]|uniref:hypothetical protein n=1 Tax=Kineococcus sp. SYSU DK005 TaxID=3383126 RepID=UPI003D7D9982
MATIALEDVDGVFEALYEQAWPHHGEGLPTHGVLEVFHDCSTFGWQAHERAERAWLVRWVPHPQREAFAVEPADLDPVSAGYVNGAFLCRWVMSTAWCWRWRASRT